MTIDPTPASPEPTPTPGTPETPPTPPGEAVEAQIQQALAQQQTEFQAQLKEATGFDSIKAFTTDQLKQQGKLQELADNHAQEAQTYKQRFEQSQITASILAASNEALDSEVVQSLLASQAVCDENGQVTIEGKSVDEAVKALLEAKPFLAKSSAYTGSGSGANPMDSTPNPFAKESFNLTKQIQLKQSNPALAEQLRATAQA